MAGQKKVGNTLLDGILMPTVATNKLAFRNLCLEQQVVQILQSLLISLQLLSCRSLLRKLGKAELLAKTKPLSAKLLNNIGAEQLCWIFRPTRKHSDITPLTGAYHGVLVLEKS